MPSKNICKFPTAPLIGSILSISCFVRESDPTTMKRASMLKTHRMLLTVQGSGAFQIDNVRVPFRRGSLLFGFAGEMLSLCDGENVSYMYIDFAGARAEELLRRFDITALSRIYDSLDGLIPLWQESLSRASDGTIDLAAESILLYTFSRLFGAESERNGIIGRIAEITEQCFNDPDLNLSAIAQELSYHPKYVSHLFKEKMGISYSEYLRSVRLKYATALFDHGIDSVKNVAILSGFSDPLYFSNVFKKCVGISPKEYIAAKNRQQL
ncbi:MAG: helix-turn-helix transcriptional regulator [Clostridia bacterium]|nr:helix-turn-helix transcriptional regulator [Clostridia bacterium]